MKLSRNKIAKLLKSGNQSRKKGNKKMGPKVGQKMSPKVRSKSLDIYDTKKGVAFTEDDLILTQGKAIRKKAKTMHLKTKPLNLRFKTLKNMRAGVGSKKEQSGHMRSGHKQSGGATTISVLYYDPQNLSPINPPLRISIEDGNVNLIEKIKNDLRGSGVNIENNIYDFGGVTYYNALYKNHILLKPEDTLTTLGLPVGTTPIEFRVRSKAYVFFYRIFYGDLFYMVNVFTIGNLISYLKSEDQYKDLIYVFSSSGGGFIKKGGEVTGTSGTVTSASETGTSGTGIDARVENKTGEEDTEESVVNDLKTDLAKDDINENDFSGGGTQEGLASFKQILVGNVPTSKPAKPKNLEIWKENDKVTVKGKVTNDSFKYDKLLPLFMNRITLDNPLIPIPSIEEGVKIKLELILAAKYLLERSKNPAVKYMEDKNMMAKLNVFLQNTTQEDYKETGKLKNEEMIDLTFSNKGNEKKQKTLNYYSDPDTFNYNKKKFDYYTKMVILCNDTLKELKVSLELRATDLYSRNYYGSTSRFDKASNSSSNYINPFRSKSLLYVICRIEALANGVGNTDPMSLAKIITFYNNNKTFPFVKMNFEASTADSAVKKFFDEIKPQELGELLYKINDTFIRHDLSTYYKSLKAIFGETPGGTLSNPLSNPVATATAATKEQTDAAQAIFSDVEAIQMAAQTIKAYADTEEQVPIAPSLRGDATSNADTKKGGKQLGGGEHTVEINAELEKIANIVGKKAEAAEGEAVVADVKGKLDATKPDDANATEPEKIKFKILSEPAVVIAKKAVIASTKNVAKANTVKEGEEGEEGESKFTPKELKAIKNEYDDKKKAFDAAQKVFDEAQNALKQKQDAVAEYKRLQGVLDAAQAAAVAAPADPALQKAADDALTAISNFITSSSTVLKDIKPPKLVDDKYTYNSETNDKSRQKDVAEAKEALDKAQEALEVAELEKAEKLKGYNQTSNIATAADDLLKKTEVLFAAVKTAAGQAVPSLKSAADAAAAKANAANDATTAAARAAAARLKSQQESSKSTSGLNDKLLQSLIQKIASLEQQVKENALKDQLDDESAQIKAILNGKDPRRFVFDVKIPDSALLVEKGTSGTSVENAIKGFVDSTLQNQLDSANKLLKSTINHYGNLLQLMPTISKLNKKFDTVFAASQAEGVNDPAQFELKIYKDQLNKLDTTIKAIESELEENKKARLAAQKKKEDKADNAEAAAAGQSGGGEWEQEGGGRGPDGGDQLEGRYKELPPLVRDLQKLLKGVMEKEPAYNQHKSKLEALAKASNTAYVVNDVIKTGNLWYKKDLYDLLVTGMVVGGEYKEKIRLIDIINKSNKLVDAKNIIEQIIALYNTFVTDETKKEHKLSSYKLHNHLTWNDVEKGREPAPNQGKRALNVNPYKKEALLKIVNENAGILGPEANELRNEINNMSSDAGGGFRGGARYMQHGGPVVAARATGEEVEEVEEVEGNVKPSLVKKYNASNASNPQGDLATEYSKIYNLLKTKGASVDVLKKAETTFAKAAVIPVTKAGVKEGEADDATSTVTDPGTGKGPATTPVKAPGSITDPKLPVTNVPVPSTEELNLLDDAATQTDIIGLAKTLLAIGKANEGRAAATTPTPGAAPQGAPGAVVAPVVNKPLVAPGVPGAADALAAVTGAPPLAGADALAKGPLAAVTGAAALAKDPADLAKGPLAAVTKDAAALANPGAAVTAVTAASKLGDPLGAADALTKLGGKGGFRGGARYMQHGGEKEKGANQDVNPPAKKEGDPAENKEGDPEAKKEDPEAKKEDPEAKKEDSEANKEDPEAKKEDSEATEKGGPAATEKGEPPAILEPIGGPVESKASTLVAPTDEEVNNALNQFKSSLPPNLNTDVNAAVNAAEKNNSVNIGDDPLAATELGAANDDAPTDDAPTVADASPTVADAAPTDPNASTAPLADAAPTDLGAPPVDTANADATVAPIDTANAPIEPTNPIDTANASTEPLVPGADTSVDESTLGGGSKKHKRKSRKHKSRKHKTRKHKRSKNKQSKHKSRRHKSRKHKRSEYT